MDEEPQTSVSMSSVVCMIWNDNKIHGYVKVNLVNQHIILMEVSN